MAAAFTFTGAQFIGRHRSSEGTSTLQGKNPINGEQLDEKFFEATVAEVDQALTLAKKASEQPLSAQQCSDLLNAIAEEIEGLGQPLLDRCHLETALPFPRLEGERGRTCFQLRTFAKLVEQGWHLDARIDTADPDRSPIPKPDVRSLKVPIGPVVIFGASNFPLAFSVAGGDTASALAAGCPVVVKAHEAHPGTSEMIAHAIAAAVERCGIHPGYFSMLYGQGPTIGQALVNHPQTTAVGFTGSLKAGKAIFDAAQQRPVPIPVYAEMGSVNLVLMLPGALKEQGDELAKGLVGSVTLGVGQFCTNPGVVATLTEQATSAQFRESVTEGITQCSPGVMLNDSVFSGYQKSREQLAQIPGVKQLAASTEKNQEALAAQAMLFAADVETLLSNADALEEVFGPSTLLTQGNAKQLEQLVEVLPGQLTGTVFGTDEDFEQFSSVITKLQSRVGRVICNAFPTGVEVCHAMNHGGPFPATTDVRSSSVGTRAVDRFLRPLCYQGWPNKQLPVELQDENPRGIRRLVNGEWTSAKTI